MALRSAVRSGGGGRLKHRERSRESLGKGVFTAAPRGGPRSLHVYSCLKLANFSLSVLQFGRDG